MRQPGDVPRPRPNGTSASRRMRTTARVGGLVVALGAAIVTLSGSLPVGLGAEPSPGRASRSETASADRPRVRRQPIEPSASVDLPIPSASPRVGVSRGYLADRTDLLERVKLAKAGRQPYRSALDDLLAWARGARKRTPDPATSLRIKGTEGPFVDDTSAAYGLALAYVATGDECYGKAAVRHIMAWVDTTTKTRDTCPDSGACQTSLIISRTVPGFVFAADLLEGSGLLDPAREARFRAWLRDLMLPVASELDNNWGDAGTFTRIVLTDYLDDQAGFDAAIAKWRSLMDLVAKDGHIPLEVARESAGIGYSQEALDYKVASARIAERRGVDLWSYVGAKGGSLKRAVDYVARYLKKPSQWPWHGSAKRPGPSPMWEIAYAHWADPDYRSLVRERRPQGLIGHSAVLWTTWTDGVRLGS